MKAGRGALAIKALHGPRQSGGRGGGLSALAALGPGSRSSRQSRAGMLARPPQEPPPHCLQADGSGQSSWML